LRAGGTYDALIPGWIRFPGLAFFLYIIGSWIGKFDRFEFLWAGLFPFEFGSPVPSSLAPAVGVEEGDSPPAVPAQPRVGPAPQSHHGTYILHPSSLPCPAVISCLFRVLD
jgi:hypothetical protein